MFSRCAEKWVVRMVIPEELRGVVGQRELVEIGLASEARAREKSAIKATVIPPDSKGLHK